ncbi:MAG: hypothetical protein ACFFAH_03595 [Promethearchaeota archaeon]
MSMAEEFFEIEVIVECPDCKARWYDWIPYEPSLPEVIEEKCTECRVLNNLKKYNEKKKIDYSQLFE